jgi:hypothetical protein
MQQVQQRLERLEGRLKSLDARVGGGSVREVPAMQLQPNIAPSSS